MAINPLINLFKIKKIKTIEDIITILKTFDMGFHKEYVESQGDELKQFMTINPRKHDYEINFEKVKTIEDVITILKPFEHDYVINFEEVKTVEDVATLLTSSLIPALLNDALLNRCEELDK